jgi:predicted nuclease with TOPRIM domain
MKKIFKKINKSHKKYSKKGGILFTRTSKYRDIKTEKATLEEDVNRLELQLENYTTEILALFEELENCRKKYKPNPSDYPLEEENMMFNQKGGIFGFSLASNYKNVKNEKINLEEKRKQLLQQITAAKERIQNLKNRVRICRQINWENDLKVDVIEKGKKDIEERTKKEQERERQPEEPEPTVTCDPFGFCSSRGGKRKKTKKANKKRKVSHRRR